MNYEELYVKISEIYNRYKDQEQFAEVAPYLLAFREVVALHKRCTNGATLPDYAGPIFGNCEGCRAVGGRIEWERCPTIQTIEKELK